jgi:hypothetical protein
MKKLRGNLRRVVLACSICAGLFFAGTARSQSSVEDALKQFAGESVKGYAQPLADLFGANLNSGFLHSASIGKMGFHFRLEIVGMGALVGDKQKSYTAKTPVGFEPATFETATIFGGEATTVQGTGNSAGLSYRGTADGVIDTPILPLAAPQISIGDFYGTRAVVRLLPIPKFGDNGFPSGTFWGIGVQHSISQYLPSVPVDIAAHIYYSKVTFGDLIDASGLAIGVEGGKSISVLDLFAGLEWEKSSLKLSYTPTVTNVPLSVDFDGANSFRFILGLGLNLGPVSLFGDANFGSITCFAAGIGFGS